MEHVKYIEVHCEYHTDDCILKVDDGYFGYKYDGDPFMIERTHLKKEEALVFKGTEQPLAMISLLNGKNFKILPAK